MRLMKIAYDILENGLTLMRLTKTAGDILENALLCQSRFAGFEFDRSGLNNGISDASVEFDPRSLALTEY